MSSIDVNKNFEDHCWHDCRIWGIEFHTGEPEQDDWISDLRLDIDYICQWICDAGPCRFRVAPALLVFHEVMNLAISFERRDAAEYSVPAHPLSISEIERQSAIEYRSATDQFEHQWKIKLNDPEGGLISFLASGFTQTLRTEPVLLDKQGFSLRERQQLLAPLEK